MNCQAPRLLGIAALFVLTALAGCAKPGTVNKTEPTRALPAISGVQLSVPPDTRTPLGQIPWCADSEGHSPVYPCKWDRRLRPVSGWAPEVGPIVIWVSDHVCPIGKVDTGGDMWWCFWAPPPLTS